MFTLPVVTPGSAIAADDIIITAILAEENKRLFMKNLLFYSLGELRSQRAVPCGGS
jgi:hypothetical protein